MRLIPAIDLRDGRCVRLFQGDFARATVYDMTPGELAASYREWGASYLHVVDLDGARAGASLNLDAIRTIAAVPGIRIQAGGGVREPADADRLIAQDVRRVVVGSLAVIRPARMASLLQDYGPDSVVVALDVRMAAHAEPLVAVNAWTCTSDLTLWDALERHLDSGLLHVLCTDISRDGALTGPNVDLYRACQRRFPQVLWQASGGVRSADDLRALADAGVSAAVSGKALIENRIADEDLQPFLRDA